MKSDLIIFAKYKFFKDANEDAQLLKRAGIPAVVETLNPGAAMYNEEYAEIVLMIPAEDEAWAIEVFQAEGYEYEYENYDEEGDLDYEEGEYDDDDDYY